MLRGRNTHGNETAVGGAPMGGSSTMTAVGAAPGGRFTMTAVGAPAGGVVKQWK